jgi:hypothetical protein
MSWLGANEEREYIYLKSSHSSSTAPMNFWEVDGMGGGPDDGMDAISAESMGKFEEPD